MSVKKIMMIAGEASGDLHGAALIMAIKEKEKNVEIFGVGGDRMRDSGMELFYHVKDLAFIGISEVIRHLAVFRRIFYTLLKEIDKRHPDILILIDYPGFNIRFGKKAKQKGMKVFYYIAPQVWAWHQSRAKKMAKFIDRMAVIFDFEEDFFKKYKIDTHFVGHPLLDSIKTKMDKDSFYKKYSLNNADPLLALLPGSRKQEVENLLSAMLKTAELLKTKNNRMQIAISQAETISDCILENFDTQNLVIIKGDTYDLLQNADAAIVASGTATLETCYFLTPFVILYSISSLSYFLGKRLVKIPFIGLVNIVGGDEIAKEFIQKNIDPFRIAQELEKCLWDPEYRKGQIEKLLIVKGQLGKQGAAEKTAHLVMDMIN